MVGLETSVNDGFGFFVIVDVSDGENVAVSRELKGWEDFDLFTFVEDVEG